MTFEGEPQVQPHGTGVIMKDLYGNEIDIKQRLMESLGTYRTLAPLSLEPMKPEKS